MSKYEEFIDLVRMALHIKLTEHREYQGDAVEALQKAYEIAPECVPSNKEQMVERVHEYVNWCMDRYVGLGSAVRYSAAYPQPRWLKFYAFQYHRIDDNNQYIDDDGELYA